LKNFAQKTILNMIFQIISKSVIFLIFIVLAQTLSQSTFGEFVFGYNAARHVSLLLMLGSSAVLVKHWGDVDLSTSARECANFHYMNWYLVIAIAVVLMLFLFIKISEIFGFALNFTNLEKLSFLFAFSIIPATLFQHYFISIKKPHFGGFYQVSLNLVWMLITVVSLMVGYLHNNIYVFSSACAMLICAIAIWSLLAKSYGAYIKKPRNHNKVFIFSHVGGILFGAVDLVLVKVLLGSEDVAAFGAILQLVTVVSFFLGGITSSIVPYLIESSKNPNKKIFQEKITFYVRLAAAPGIILTILILVTGKLLLSLFGDEYIHYSSVLYVFLLGGFINIICGFNGWLLNLLGDELIVAKVFGISIILKLILGVILIQSFQLLGLAYSYTLALAFWNVSLVVYLMKYKHLNSTLIPLRI
jgi:O-antigen/teichoic acid export membrane protein